MKFVCMPEPGIEQLLWNALGYREFLAAWIESEKQRRSTFSIAAAARRLSMDATLLGRILQGERHLATSRIQPVCDLVGLDGDRAEYFRHLVLHAKSKTAREAQACFERMQELRRISPAQLDDSQSSFWDSWTHVALRSLLACGSYRDDWELLGSQLHPPQSTGATQAAMQTLERLGLIAKDSDGFWRPSEPFVRDRPGSQTRALRNYHRQCMLLALDALDNIPPEARNISSVAVTVDETEYLELARMIGDLRSKALTRPSKVMRPDRVVQLNFQLFPIGGRPVTKSAK